MAENDWNAYISHLWQDPETGVSVDVSRAGITPEDRTRLAPLMTAGFTAMEALEAGGVANPDENRMVGHYWLRDPQRAPDPAVTREITDTVRRIEAFASRVHGGELTPARAAAFTRFLLIGIGGSALGPQLAAHALGGTGDRMTPHFIDNTDPDGIDAVLAEIGNDLERTLTLVVSKSGGTKETRNGMLEVRAAYEKTGLAFGPHAVAVTGAGSALEKTARDAGFLDVFPMWDWVGGRTSELSAVGLLPAALQGIDIRALLDGARTMDGHTRVPAMKRNPAALLAAAWYAAGDGRGSRDMVILPYKDRLQLLSRYLQQLVMESLGKETDRKGRVVNQGIAVYGNKGSTDQHAYVQQLRDGPDTFFATFIEVLRDREGASPDVEGGATSGDFLLGFLLGTREALSEKGRRSVTITLPEVSPFTLGMLIALYERAVGLYAELIDLNAYNQPGVEAGKQAASSVLDLQARALDALRADPERTWSAPDLAGHLGEADRAEVLFRILEHAAANPDHAVRAIRGKGPSETAYQAGS
jgi:glucose-6-phosphate isomerase